VGFYLFSSNLPAPINEGPDPQTKEGNLIIEGVLRLGRFATTNAPSEAEGAVEGALYFDTTENTTKLYSNSAWGDLGGGWDGILPNYTTAERNAIASPAYGLMIYNTDSDRVEYYLPDDWSSIQAPFATAHSCTAALDCASEICVDGYCCNTVCTGNCDRCNVVGSLGTCTEVASDCTGNCDVCSAGNCIPNASACTGNCVTCSGSGTNYSCTANDALCTGNCDVCSGSGTAYNCAANNTVCSSNPSSCDCTGSGTVFNCHACPDTYGVCGTPTCSAYTCGNTYDNDGYCAYNGYDNAATNYYCSSGSCLCTSSAGTPSPDGKDNDCDGSVDETNVSCYGSGCVLWKGLSCTAWCATQHTDCLCTNCCGWDGTTQCGSCNPYACGGAHAENYYYACSCAPAKY